MLWRYLCIPAPRCISLRLREGLKPEPWCEGSCHFSIPASSFLGPRCIVAMYSEVLILSFISAALVLVPLIWYLHARNIAAVAIGIWLSGTNLIYAVDALVWAEDADIEASVWCDLSTSFIIGSHIALPAACLSVCIHLERLASFFQTSTPQAKRRRIIFECLMCFGLPLVYIALHLIVQPRRFDLFYGFGCRPATYPAVATIFLVVVPPLVLTVATFVCAGISWRHLVVHGVRFDGKRGSISSVTRNLYLRLIGMALLEVLSSAILVVVVMWVVVIPRARPHREYVERSESDSYMGR
ncbi:pheromone A receptor-domain-containing protein [Boletus coccyginus]|nr:pheromone A receptor-domain-containing protein [Boletus coccyginus]